MWPSASSEPARGFLVVGSPGSRRVGLFQGALAAMGLPAARVMSPLDLIDGRIALPDVAMPGTVVRIESCGKDFPVEKALLALGADVPEDAAHARMESGAAKALVEERGRILFPRQWFLGFRELLRRIEAQVKECPGARVMNGPADVEVMFDKPASHARLAAAGVPVARSLGVVAGYDDLLARMARAKCARVFLKLAHGSSASGAVAFETRGARQQATTTVEVVERGGERALFNSRRLRVHRDPATIAALVDALARHRLHAEAWVPKAGFQGRTCDLRVVVIAGRACHVVVRLSRGPITNLHLLNARGDAEALAARAGPARWQAALAACEAAAAAFPGSLYAGVDLLLAPGFRRHAVLEVNAFGDLLPGVAWRGMDTYEAEIRAVLGGEAPGVPGREAAGAGRAQ